MHVLTWRSPGDPPTCPSPILSRVTSTPEQSRAICSACSHLSPSPCRCCSFPQRLQAKALPSTSYHCSPLSVHGRLSASLASHLLGSLMLSIFLSLAYFFHLVSGLDASLQCFFPHFLFVCIGSSLWPSGSSCLTRDQLY